MGGGRPPQGPDSSSWGPHPLLALALSSVRWRPSQPSLPGRWGVWGHHGASPHPHPDSLVHGAVPFSLGKSHGNGHDQCGEP